MSNTAFNLKLRLSLGSALAGLVGMVWSGAAFAAAAPDDSTQLETVVVTAEKRSEKLHDVAAAVTALDTAALALQGNNSLTDYVSRIPGVTLSSQNPGFQQITLRGITTGRTQTASTTAVAVDEAPVGSVNAYAEGSSNTLDLDPADIERVEVLKGPQGTLYGAGAMGGLLKYVMREPDATTLFGHVSASSDIIDQGGMGYRLTGTVNVPLVENVLAVKVNAYERSEPGFIDNVNGSNDYNPNRIMGGRAAIGWKVNDNIKVKISAILQDVHDHGWPSEDLNYQTLQPVHGDLKDFRYFPESAQASLRLYNGTIEGNWGSLDIVSSTTYQRYSMNMQYDATPSYGVYLGSALHIANFGVVPKVHVKTERIVQEFRASDNAFGGALEYQFGLYFTHENDLRQIPGFEALDTVTGDPISVPELAYAANRSRYTEYSAFGNATYHFTDRFDVMAGLRLAYDEQHYNQFYRGLIVGPTPIQFAKKAVNRVANYQVTPRFKIDDDQMVYAKIATGYRAGGPNTLPPTAVVPGVPQDFAPDRLISYETGYKATFLNNSLSLDTALYYNKWKNVQIKTGSSGYSYIVNGGTARTEGVEFAVAYVPVAGLTLGVNGSYIVANLTSDALGAGGHNGDRLPYVPEWSGSLTADYHWDLTSSLIASVGGALNYTGNRRNDYSLRVPVKVPSYTTADLHVAVDYQDWNISLFAKNIGDTRGIVTMETETLAVGNNPYEAFIIQPRTFGLQVTARFE